MIIMSAVAKKDRKIRGVLVAVIAVFTVLLVAISIFAGVLGKATNISLAALEEDLAAQLERLERMRSDPGAPFDEQSIAAFNLATENPKINKIQMLNSHNSYRKMFSDYVVSFFKALGTTPAKSMTYEHENMVGQLNRGVRGLEIDVNFRDGRFMIYHKGLTDMGSTSPDFELALEEFKLWSNKNPGHLPVSILIEYKSTNWPWNIQEEKPNEGLLRKLDAQIRAFMGDDKLITPADIIGGYANMGEAIENNNWPTLSEAKGKFMFILHYDDSLTDKLIETDKSLKSLAMFPSISFSEKTKEKQMKKYKEYASHIIFNEPDDGEIIKEMVSKNYIVRTRIDEGMEPDPDRKEVAVGAGAQMLTTDFVPGLPFPQTDYTAYLQGNYTALLYGG